MAQQLKFFVRGTKDSYLKFQQRSTCPQEQIAAGVKPLDPGFGVESEPVHNLLTTYDEFNGSVQSFDLETRKYVGRYPTITGRWMGLYENVANAINGKGELAVRAAQSRGVLWIIELARESHENDVTVAWR